MALEYGDLKVVRFTYDVNDRKLTIFSEQPIIEDGVEVSKVFPKVIARDAEFDAILGRILPSDSTMTGARDKLESEAKQIINEKKQEKINDKKSAESPSK